MIHKRTSHKFTKATRKKVVQYLILKSIETTVYLDAFDYFTKYPQRFDGATFVKDLIDVEGIDLAAMKHDFLYLTDLKNKLKHDITYGKDMVSLGKGNAYWYRVVLLFITTPLYPFFKFIKNKTS